jgi:3-oxoacyl-[acyl-carrier-protein] synthase II
MENRRVVVTGMGVIAPNGIGVEAFWDSLVHGRSGVRRITHFDASTYPTQVAAEVIDFEPKDHMDSKNVKRLARFAQFVLAASREAIEDAACDFSAEDPYRTGVIIATGIGGGEVIETQHTIFLEKGLKRMSPYTSVSSCTHSAVGVISYEYGLKGPNTTIAAGCNSGLDALTLAFNTIFTGDADLMLVGAGEAPITPYIYGAFSIGGFLSRANGEPSTAVKPYDIHGDGTVIGEGGALLILEERKHALQRKAKIYGEILGFASANEAYSFFETETSGKTLAKAIQKCLGKSQLSSQDIDYINAHGNGLPAYDANETKAIKEAFGELAYNIPVTSIKPVTGQSFSVTGILQMITCLLVLNRKIIPPTLNHHIPAPGCDLDYVPRNARQKDVTTALMNAHGFGGSHTVITVRKDRVEFLDP